MRRAVAGATAGFALLAVGAVATFGSSEHSRHRPRASIGGVRGAGAAVAYHVGAIARVSVGCPGTGDAAAAVGRGERFVYMAFEGCADANGVGFARSTDAGATYARPRALPGSVGGWDPQLAVAPDGTLYAAFMNTIGGRTYPIIDVSRDSGRSFRAQYSLRPARPGNWGDAENLAVGRDGRLYVAWGYGPSDDGIDQACARDGSCFVVRGAVNVVVQSSPDRARRFTPMSVVTPGYPRAGADEGAIALTPSGAVDVLYQGYRVVNRRTLELAHGHQYFTSSTDRGRTWSRPVLVAPSAGEMTIHEWWNDGSIAADAAGNLYAAWDTQRGSDAHRADIGWVAFSTDGGRHWSRPLQAPSDRANAPHIVEVAGAGRGQAYVGWLSSSARPGYALYLRLLSVAGRAGAGKWLSKPIRISRQFGIRTVFPGDTFGIAARSRGRLWLSWSSAPPGSGSVASLFAAPVEVHARLK